mmetsp:Transcript_16545/g.30501  ORF Transcript_16545/g.30501 Transcript_16545/m.30501 type:complete len:248 (+) Transcript_16545:2241-2984(+)
MLLHRSRCIVGKFPKSPDKYRTACQSGWSSKCRVRSSKKMQLGQWWWWWWWWWQWNWCWCRYWWRRSGCWPCIHIAIVIIQCEGGFRSVTAQSTSSDCAALQVGWACHCLASAFAELNALLHSFFRSFKSGRDPSCVTTRVLAHMLDPFASSSVRSWRRRFWWRWWQKRLNLCCEFCERRRLFCRWCDRLLCSAASVAKGASGFSRAFPSILAAAGCKIPSLLAICSLLHTPVHFLPSLFHLRVTTT